MGSFFSLTAANQETESLENPFNKLAPEVVAHILSFLADIPSRMSASGVCRLWRKLVDWKEVKQLQLDFGHMRINEVPLGLPKWPSALESLLPFVDLTSLKVCLTKKRTSFLDNDGDPYWRLCLMECGVAINQLTNQQSASLSHITHVRISGRPNTPEFEFVSRLLELCPSLTHLLISTPVFLQAALLKSTLRNKRLVELDINISHLTGKGSSEYLAQLCQVLAPGTLKSLTLDGGKNATDHRYGLVFLKFCQAMQKNAGCLSALESLTIITPSLDLGIDSADHSQMEAFLVQVPSLVNYVLPKLQVLELTIPGCECDYGDWILLQEMLMVLSAKFNHPLHVSLLTDHCTVLGLYLAYKSRYSVNNPLCTLETRVTEQGFNCTKVRFSKDEVAPRIYKRLRIWDSAEMPLAGRSPIFLVSYKFLVAPIEVAFKRLPPVDPGQCPDLCPLEYGLVKQQLIDRLNGEASKDELRVFACQIPHLQVDLMDQFPSLSVSEVQNGSVKIKIKSKTVFNAAVIEHDAICIRNICVGCAMLPQSQ